MSRAALSIFVYGCYLVILSLTLFLIPNIALQIVGLDAHQDVWIYVVAMSVLFLAGYFIVAARKEVTEIFWLSVVFRLSVPLFFGLVESRYVVPPFSVKVSENRTGQETCILKLSPRLVSKG
jgi:hypothetical protein